MPCDDLVPVAERRERLGREVRVGDLDLLQADHVGLRSRPGAPDRPRRSRTELMFQVARRSVMETKGAPEKRTPGQGGRPGVLSSSRSPWTVGEPVLWRSCRCGHDHCFDRDGKRLATDVNCRRKRQFRGFVADALPRQVRRRLRRPAGAAAPALRRGRGRPRRRPRKSAIESGFSARRTPDAIARPAQIRLRPRPATASTVPSSAHASRREALRQPVDRPASAASSPGSRPADQRRADHARASAAPGGAGRIAPRRLFVWSLRWSKRPRPDGPAVCSVPPSATFSSCSPGRCRAAAGRPPAPPAMQRQRRGVALRILRAVGPVGRAAIVMGRHVGGAAGHSSPSSRSTRSAMSSGRPAPG